MSECVLFLCWINLNERQCQHAEWALTITHSLALAFSTRRLPARLKRGAHKAAASLFLSRIDRNRAPLRQVIDGPLKVTPAWAVWPRCLACLTYIARLWLNIYNRPLIMDRPDLIWTTSEDQFMTEAISLTLKHRPNPTHKWINKQTKAKQTYKRAHTSCRCTPQDLSPPWPCSFENKSFWVWCASV